MDCTTTPTKNLCILAMGQFAPRRVALRERTNAADCAADLPSSTRGTRALASSAVAGTDTPIRRGLAWRRRRAVLHRGVEWVIMSVVLPVVYLYVDVEASIHGLCSMLIGLTSFHTVIVLVPCCLTRFNSACAWDTTQTPLSTSGDLTTAGLRKPWRCASVHKLSGVHASSPP